MRLFMVRSWNVFAGGFCLAFEHHRAGRVCSKTRSRTESEFWKARNLNNWQGHRYDPAAPSKKHRSRFVLRDHKNSFIFMGFIQSGGAQLLLCLSAGIWSLKDTKLHVHLESPKGAQHSRQAQWSSRRATTTAAARQAFCPVIFLLCTRCVFILISSSVKEWKVPSESWDRVSVLLLLQTREATYRLCVHMFSQPHSMLVNTVIFRGSTFSYYCFISLFICEHKQSDKSNKTKCNKQIRDCAGEVRNPKGLIVKTSPLWFKVYPNRIQSMILILWTFYSLTWWEKEKKTGFWKRNTTWKFWFP